MLRHFCSIRDTFARFVIKVIIRSRLVNPWFQSKAGKEYICDCIINYPRAAYLSAATRRRFYWTYVTKRLFIQPYRRWRFYRREGRYPPALLAISPTTHCNLRCGGCYAAGRETQELSRETVHRVLNEANAMGTSFFTIVGGEPFCWEPLLETLEQFNTSLFLIYTNGTLITDDVAQRLAGAGNALITFSIEGYEEETDRRRGAGTFATIIAAMARLKSAGVRFGFSVTVTRHNNETVASEAFIDYFTDIGCMSGCYFNYIPIGREPDTELMPTPAQRDTRRRLLNRLRRGRNIILFDFWNDGPLVCGCLGAGTNYLHINASGQVEPCVFYHFATDSIHDKTLLEVLNSPFFKTIRSQQKTCTNWIAPCPIIDHPALLRDAVREADAQPTHDGAAQFLDTLQAPLDRYGAAYRALAETARLEEQQENSSV